MPRTDPDRRLDLAALMDGRVSDPDAWPEPFASSSGERPQLVEAEPGHFVRALASFGKSDAA